MPVSFITYKDLRGVKTKMNNKFLYAAVSMYRLNPITLVGPATANLRFLIATCC